MSWRRYFQRARRDDDLADEIAHYVNQETDDNSRLPLDILHEPLAHSSV